MADPDRKRPTPLQMYNSVLIVNTRERGQEGPASLRNWVDSKHCSNAVGFC